METRVIQRAYKTELDPNAKQREAFLRHAGACRFLYNLALERCKLQYELARASGRFQRTPRAMGLNLELTELKRTECPWLYGISNNALQNALRQCDAAYQNFFRRLKEGKRGKAAGLPRYKSKKHGVGSFKLNDCIHVGERTIQLPTIGRVRLKERGYLPTTGVRITSATVSERAGRWYVSIQIEQELPAPPPVNNEVVGVDLGVAHLAALSDGTVIPAHRALRRHEKKLKRLEHSLSKKQEGGANRAKARRRLARAHAKVANIRQHMIHEATTAIVKRYGVVVMEDLNVSGLMRNHSIAKSVSDAAMAEFRRQIAYKLDWSGGVLILADRWFPSSKLCSQCGAIKEDLTLDDRVYRCDCGLVMDRDLNAAINLRSLAVKQTESLNACGPAVRLNMVEHAGLRQESMHARADYAQGSLWQR